MIHPFFEGILLGITVSVSLGPALLALLQTSVKHGIKTGIFFAIGIFTSDLIVVMVAYFGASQIVTNSSTHKLFGIIGGSILIIFGLFQISRKMQKSEQVKAIREIKVKNPGVLPYYFKGFLLNIANPFLWAFWLTSVIAISSSYRGNRLAIVLFLSGTLGTVLATDILKCILANKIKLTGNPYVKLWINRIVGIIFILFGVFVIINVMAVIPNPMK
ncbi:MAG: LysE family transporter [Bacteroidetes bacterium]|nr:LysE family transporter [Bacteroidota bacterium]